MVKVSLLSLTKTLTDLTLPEYTSQQILKERLLFAINTDADSMDADQPQEDAGGNRLSPFNNEYSDSDSE